MHIHTNKEPNSCIPPAYVSCHISGATVTQQIGKRRCSLQRLEECCHTLYRSLFVWLILTGPIHHCWACWLSLQHNHCKQSNFSTGWMLLRPARFAPLALFLLYNSFIFFFYLALSLSSCFLLFCAHLCLCLHILAYYYIIIHCCTLNYTHSVLLSLHSMLKITTCHYF